MFVWIIDFPVVEWNEDEKRWDAVHHPFTAPREEDLPLLESDPGRARARAYDLVLNGQEAAGGSIRIHQDVDLYASLLREGEALAHTLRPGRHAWLQVARGHCTLNESPLEAGDGAAISGETALRLVGAKDAEVLLFDLA